MSLSHCRNSMFEADQKELALTDDSRTETFLSLLMVNQSKIYSYILSLVPHFNDAEEILQETLYVMWSKFDQFEIGSHFDSWGVKIAYYNILIYRKNNKKKMYFSDSVFEQANEIATRKFHAADERITALRSCIKKLDDDDQKLLKARYEWNDSVDSIAQELNRSNKFVYKRLSQLLQALYGSVKKTMQEQ